MKKEEFEKLFDDVVGHERMTLIAKAQDYAGLKDRLQNFRDGAHISGLRPTQTLWCYMTKHLASVREIAWGKTVSRETIREKIGDARNYLVLLEALLIDTQGETK